MIERMNAILASEGIPAIAAGSILATPRKVDDQTQLRAALEAFGAADGWLCLTDEVIEVPPGYDFGQLTGRTILSGEVAAGDNSLHLRQHGAGWLAVELRREAGAGSYLTEQTFMPTRGKRRLRYEVCWSAGTDGILSPTASRFAGFVTGGDDHE